ncbi:MULTISPECIES: hypothetical protein [Chryseobacterium]|uniref:Uncharacterized protein n=1 Tax=Candidatus Chryseobacterium massiliense TaxID=204089 RepID=A0A3D9BBC6_9FLAO|nr:MULTISPECIES: hypothetical protein [Chryseobacterium]REC50626.1 hypothetical protein DRF68_09020 [Candidatus Chryseobacterium massiliae]
MKTLIPLLSLVCGSFAVQSCGYEDQEFQNQTDTVQAVAEDHPMSYSSRQDSSKSKDSGLYPDPPVKDTHDWRTKP